MAFANSTSSPCLLYTSCLQSGSTVAVWPFHNPLSQPEYGCRQVDKPILLPASCQHCIPSGDVYKRPGHGIRIFGSIQHLTVRIDQPIYPTMFLVYKLSLIHISHLKSLINSCKKEKVRIIFVQPEFDRRNACLLYTSEYPCRHEH